MKSIVFALTLIAMAACRTAPSDSTSSEVSFRVLETGSYASAANATPGTQTEASVHLASSDAEYRELWRRHISGEMAPPAVDFARETVVFLLVGQRSSGGWSVEPEAVSVDGELVEVTAPVARPEPGGMVTMAFSAPFAVVAIERPSLTAAVWTGGGGTPVARSGEVRER